MDSKHATRFGRARRIIPIKAPTAPTITKLFQRQPLRIKFDAVRRDGFSQKRLTSEIKSPGSLASGARLDPSVSFLGRFRLNAKQDHTLWMCLRPTKSKIDMGKEYFIICEVMIGWKEGDKPVWIHLPHARQAI